MGIEKHLRRFARVWLLCALMAFVFGCERPDPEEEIDAAIASISTGEFEDAALRLNYVIRLQPDNVRARGVRGDLALMLGDYASATSDYEYLRGLGASTGSFALNLAEALTGQGRNMEAIEALSIVSDEDRNVRYWVLQAEALLASERLAEADRAISKAIQIGGDQSRAWAAKARVAFESGEAAAAFQALQKAIEIAPNDALVRLASAEIYARIDQLDNAVAELSRAADIYKDSKLATRETLSLLALVQIHVARNDLAEAEAIAARLAQLAPGVHLTSYYQGLIRFRRAQYDEAAALVQPLVSAAPAEVHYRSLLGAIQLARGNLGQAEQQFLRVLAISPRDPAASKLLAETRLRQQRPDAALDALLAVQDAAVTDPQIGLLSGVATVLAGDAEQGLLYLEQAAGLDPTNELLKLQLVRAYFATGRGDEASSLLAETFDDVEAETEADLLRLYAASRQQDEEVSAAIAEKLLADHPDTSRVLTAVAIHFQLNGDADRARVLFERAAVSESGSSTARLFLAAFLVQEGRQDDAEQLLGEVIAEQPDNAQASVGLAQLLVSRGATADAEMILRAASDSAKSVSPQLALVKLLLREGDLDAAKRELDGVEILAPNNSEVIWLNGVIALAEGRIAEAIPLLERADELLPDQLGVALALARARLANGEIDEAREVLLRTLEIAPQSYPVRLALGDVELRGGNSDAALSVANGLKVEFPSQAGGYVLEGRAFVESRQYDAAIVSLGRAFDLQRSWPILAMKIQALRLAGRDAEAADANKSWQSENPGHVPAGLMQSVMLQYAGQYREALDAYLEVLANAPENLVALNNAAWVAHEVGSPEALTLAERAYAVGPENPAVLDTLGWILLADGQDELALEKLTKASELAPQAPEIRYHFAAALVANDRPDRARTILEALLADSRDFEEREDAEKLLGSI